MNIKSKISDRCAEHFRRIVIAIQDDSPGKRLKRAMKFAKIDQKTLAAAVGISQQQVSFLVNDKRQIDKYAGPIASFLDIRPQWLMHGGLNTGTDRCKEMYNFLVNEIGELQEFIEQIAIEAKTSAAMKTPGDRVRLALDQAGMTVKELSESVGVSYPIVSNIVNDRRPGRTHWAKIADALGISVQWISDGSNPPAWCSPSDSRCPSH